MKIRGCVRIVPDVGFWFVRHVVEGGHARAGVSAAAMSARAAAAIERRATFGGMGLSAAADELRSDRAERGARHAGRRARCGWARVVLRVVRGTERGPRFDG